MARNSLAGSTRGTSKSARYYQNNPDARAQKNKYNTEYHKTPRAKKYRGALLKLLKRKKNKLKKRGKLRAFIDNAHNPNGKGTRRQSASTNRGNNRPKVKQTLAPVFMKSRKKKQRG
jgi:hypothetical protein